MIILLFGFIIIAVCFMGFSFSIGYERSRKMWWIKELFQMRELHIRLKTNTDRIDADIIKCSKELRLIP